MLHDPEGRRTEPRRRVLPRPADALASLERRVTVAQASTRLRGAPMTHRCRVRTACFRVGPARDEPVTYRIAFGPCAGHTVLTLRGAMPREAAARQRLCADIDGFSLHAAVRVEAHGGDREDPHPPGVGSPPAAPGTGERGGPRVRRRLSNARHPGRASWAVAQALQPGWRLRAMSGIRSEPAIEASIAIRARSPPGRVHDRVPPNGRLRVVQPTALGACCPLPGLVRAFEIPLPSVPIR